jgi:hypothetical protein
MAEGFVGREDLDVGKVLSGPEAAGDLEAGRGGVVKHRSDSAAREALELDGAARVEEEKRFNRDLLPI